MTEKNLVHELLTKLEEHISGHSFGESPAELYDPITYIMSLGGKRIRPLLSLLAYGMYGKNPEDILPSICGFGSISGPSFSMKLSTFGSVFNC